MAKASKPQPGASVLEDILATLKPGEEPTPAQKAAQKALSEYQQRKQELGASVKGSVVSNVSLEKEIKKTNILLTKLITSTVNYNEGQKERSDNMLKLLKSIKDGLFGENYREALKAKSSAILPTEDNKGRATTRTGGGLADLLSGLFSGSGAAALGAGGALGFLASKLPRFLGGAILRFGLVGGLASIVYSRLSDSMKASLDEWGINENTVLPLSVAATAFSFIPGKYLAVGGLVGGLTYWLFDKLGDNVKASLEEYGITATTTGAAAGIAATIASLTLGSKEALTAVSAVSRGLYGLGTLLAASITPAGVV